MEDIRDRNVEPPGMRVSGRLLRRGRFGVLRWCGRRSMINVSTFERQAVSVPSGRLAFTAVVAAIVAVPFLLMLPYIDQPLHGDEGVYATVSRSLLHGGVPYQDLFDNKPPLLYGWYSAGFLVFGETAEAMRLIGALVMSATTLLVFVEGRLLFSNRAGLVGAAAFAVSQALLPTVDNGLPEAFMLLPMVGAVVALTRATQSKRGRWFLLAGALGAAAVMTKPVAIWSVVALGAYTVVWAWQVRATLRGRITPPSQFAAGGLILLVATLTPFVMTSSFAAFYDANVTFNIELGSVWPYSERIPRMIAGVGRFSTDTAPFVAAAMIGFGAVVWLIRRERRPEHLVLVLFALGAAAGVASPGIYSRHNFLELLPVMAMLVAGAVYVSPRYFADDRGRAVGVMAVGGVMLGAVAFTLFWSPGESQFFADRSEDAATVPVERQYEVPGDQLVSAWAAANAGLGAYLQENTSPTDTIFVNGGGVSRSPIYFYADRDPAVRYFYTTPLMFRPELRLPRVDALAQNPPAYIVDTFWWNFQYPFPAPADDRTPEFLSLLAERYEYVDTFHFADVYRLRGHSVERPIQ